MIDITKKHVTRNGLGIAGLFEHDGHFYGYVVDGIAIFAWSWYPDGRSSKHQKSEHDLIEVKEKRVMWVSVDDDGEGLAYTCKELADLYAGGHPRIARVRVEYTEGQFDE